MHIPRWRAFPLAGAFRPVLMLALAAALSLGFGTACSLYTEDRCIVSDEEYSLAHDLFVQTGSLDIVKKSLTDKQWEDCKINESIYRLQKEFQVLPEGKPVPAGTETPAPAAITIPIPTPAAAPAR